MSPPPVRLGIHEVDDVVKVLNIHLKKHNGIILLSYSDYILSTLPKADVKDKRAFLVVLQANHYSFFYHAPDSPVVWSCDSLNPYHLTQRNLTAAVLKLFEPKELAITALPSSKQDDGDSCGYFAMAFLIIACYSVMNGHYQPTAWFPGYKQVLRSAVSNEAPALRQFLWTTCKLDQQMFSFDEKKQGYIVSTLKKILMNDKKSSQSSGPPVHKIFIKADVDQAFEDFVRAAKPKRAAQSVAIDESDEETKPIPRKRKASKQESSSSPKKSANATIDMDKIIADAMLDVDPDLVSKAVASYNEPSAQEDKPPSNHSIPQPSLFSAKQAPAMSSSWLQDLIDTEKDPIYPVSAIATKPLVQMPTLLEQRKPGRRPMKPSELLTFKQQRDQKINKPQSTPAIAIVVEPANPPPKSDVPEPNRRDGQDNFGFPAEEMRPYQGVVIKGNIAQHFFPSARPRSPEIPPLRYNIAADFFPAKARMNALSRAAFLRAHPR